MERNRMIQDFLERRWAYRMHRQMPDREAYLRDARTNLDTSWVRYVENPDGSIAAALVVNDKGVAEILLPDESPEGLRRLADHPWKQWLSEAPAEPGVSELSLLTGCHWEPSHPDFVRTNIQMEKNLTSITTDDSVTLEPQTPAEKDAMFDFEIVNFAENLRRASPRLSSDEAMAESRAKFADTEAKCRNHFLKILHAGVHAGNLWLVETSQDRFFVANIRILDAAQGQGIGRKSMLRAEEFTRNKGAGILGLHVFGHNTRACGLYQKLGFQVIMEVWKLFPEQEGKASRTASYPMGEKA